MIAIGRSSCHKYTGSAHFLDFSLGFSAEEFCLHNHWLLWKLPFPQHLEITLGGKIGRKGGMEEGREREREDIRERGRAGVRKRKRKNGEERKV